MLRSRNAPLPNVGDKFWRRMMKTFGNYNSFDSVRTRVVYVGPKLIIMEDSLSPLAGTMDNEYVAIGTEFDRDMFGYLSNFGDPLVLDSETDNNGRVIAIFSPKVNNYTVGNGGSLLGFVTSCDFAPNTDPDPNNVCVPSNEGEYFYAFVPNPNATGNDNWSLEDWRHYVRGTMLHEFKHVVMFAERISRDASFAEEPWLEEATAQMATEFWARKLYSNKGQKANIAWADGLICDYVRPGDARCADPVEAIGHHMGFLYLHYASNETKSIINNSDNVIYGSSWSFARWVTDSYGGADEGVFLRSLVQQQNDRGINNLQLRTGKTWSEMLGYWSLASASDDYPGGTINDPRARLQSWNTRNILATMSASLRYSDGTQAFPKAWPINMRAVSFGTFPSAIRNVFSLPGGGFAAWEISGTQTTPQVLAHPLDDRRRGAGERGNGDCQSEIEDEFGERRREDEKTRRRGAWGREPSRPSCCRRRRTAGKVEGFCISSSRLLRTRLLAKNALSRCAYDRNWRHPHGRGPGGLGRHEGPADL